MTIDTGRPEERGRPGPTAAGDGRFAAALAARFRLPVAADPAPGIRRVAGLSVWAAVLGLGGIMVALRAVLGLITIGAWWFGPAVVATGLVGLLCTVGAFASVHRRVLPWVLLGSATGALLAGWTLTGVSR
ncbi:MAG TPA: hypothetical protein VK453_22975 [Micromonosporaceae bacterium]|nr:hypothetical protein [Micromonosporaceae bacterium]